MIEKLNSKFSYWLSALKERFNFFSIKLATTKPIVLHLLHSPLERGTAGTEKVTRTIIEQVNEFDHVVVVILEGETKIYFNEDIFTIKNFVKKDFFKLNNSALEVHLNKIVAKIKPAVIDIQNINGYPISVLRLGQTYPLFVHLHDFGIFYPTPEKFNFKEFNVSEFLNNSKFVDQQYYQRRKKYLEELVPNIKGFISVSSFVTKVIKTTFLKEVPIHTVENVVPNELNQKSNSEKIRIVYLGLFAEHKGSQLFINLVKNDSSNEFEWSIVGKVMDGFNKQAIPKVVNLIGEYNTNDLPELLQNVDVVVIPSQVTETYNLALSEAITNKCFPIVTDNGALGYRLKTYNAGAVYSEENFVKESWKLLQLFNKNRELFNHEVAKLNNVKLPSTDDFRKAYEDLYSSVLKA